MLTECYDSTDVLYRSDYEIQNKDYPINLKCFLADYNLQNEYTELSIIQLDHCINQFYTRETCIVFMWQ